VTVGDANAIAQPISNRAFPFWYRALLSAACLWTIFNCAYVYLALDGARTYRIESAALIFVAFLLPAAFIASRAERRDEVPATVLWAIATAAAASWLAIMALRVTYPFLSDDYVFLERYRSWSDLWRVQSLFRPLFAFVFWTLSKVGGGSTVPFHLLGIGLHFGCAMLTGALVRRILDSRASGVLAFAVFLVSPLQLEATLWISGLQELLCAGFVLAGAVIYSRGTDVTVKRALLAAPFILLALLSKETAIGYMLLMPILDGALGRFTRASQVARAYAAFAFVACGYLIVRSRFTVPDSEFFAEPSRYFFKQFVTLPYKFFVQPWNAEAIDAPLLLSFVLCAAVLTLLLAAALTKRLSRVSLAGPLIVVAFSLPLYRYFFVAPDLMAARYLYLPFVGWTLLLLDMLTSTVRRPLVATIVGLIVCTSLVALRLNLRPWDTAADVIAVMASAVRDRTEPLAAIGEWERDRSIQLVRRGGVPVEYRGVYILLNGYDEFVRFASPRPSGPP
jgi:hypothetical protein